MRSEFSVTIETSNAAFGDHDMGELARILREVADQVEHESRPTSWPVRDINGNTVGRAGFGR